MRIVCETSHEAIQYAAKELRRFLGQMLSHGEEKTSTLEIQLGMYEDFSLRRNGKSAEFDDEITIAVKGGKGYIAGSNPRSVLIGVYRFLEECGARWIRPGKDGEYLPQLSDLPEKVEVCESASKRHRGVCIEGATSLENVLELIEWMPKVGFNSYFIQFRDAFIFFDRWYAHRGSPFKKPEPFTVEQSLAYVKQVQAAVKQRGMLLHMVGHGWTCEPFGVANHGWDPVEENAVPESYREVCALVNGKRDVWMKMPLATNLCYSNPRVRTTMVESVVNYLKENPSVDLLHFWLGDYYNNSCECPECRKLPVSDFYVMMLNELDRRLEEEKIPTKIVFLIYYDLMSPPVQERIQNPERFVLMFAPISRTYSGSFPEGFTMKKIKPYRINQFPLPSSVEENLAYLYQWEQLFQGDSFDFDYHLMWDHILDAGGEAIAKVIYEDIRHFDSLGLHGLVSCQLQRNFFPTSLAMQVMGRTLWNQNLEFEKIRREVYAASFGAEAAEKVEEYLSVLSQCFDVAMLRGQKKMEKESMMALLSRAVETIDAFVPVIAQGEKSDVHCQAVSWKLLSVHGKLYRLFAQSLLARIKGEKEQAEKLCDDVCRLAWEEEDSFSRCWTAFL